MQMTCELTRLGMG
jgi:hypothetical protein